MRLAISFRWVAFVVIALVLVVPSVAAQKGASLWNQDVGQAWKVTQSGTRPMLLFFTMDGCTYCEKMKHETYADERVRATIKESFVAASAEAADNPALVERFNIESYPMTMIFSPNGNVLDSIVGYISPKQMQLRLQSAVARRPTTHKHVSTNKK